MRPTFLHLLLTYRCVYQCRHCYTWGSPFRDGAMTVAQVDQILDAAKKIGSVETIVFDGGEPFLYYPILLHGLRSSRDRGFRTIVLTNGDWATSEPATFAWLGPISEAGIGEIHISDDSHHLQRVGENRGARALSVATQMGLLARSARAEGESLLHRGRAARYLTRDAPRRSWDSFAACPVVDFSHPDRIFIDCDGYVHVCHGLTIGSLWWDSLGEVLGRYDPDADPILGPLVRGGPAELARTYNLPQLDGCVDACHLCYLTREQLRERFPDRLAPEELYGTLEPEAL